MKAARNHAVNAVPVLTVQKHLQPMVLQIRHCSTQGYCICEKII